MPGRCVFLAASSPLWSSVLAASTTDEKNGAHSRARPISSSTMPELDVAVARAAELLGDVQALQAHLLAHLRPHRRVEAVLGLHLLAHGGFGALGLEEGTDGLAQLFLFFGEGKVHGPSVVDAATDAPSVLCTLWYT